MTAASDAEPFLIFPVQDHISATYTLVYTFEKISLFPWKYETSLMITFHGIPPMASLSARTCQVLLARFACGSTGDVVHLADATFFLIDRNTDWSLGHGDKASSLWV